MVAAGTPDMQGSREQGVWFRYQQIECKLVRDVVWLGHRNTGTYTWQRNTELTGSQCVASKCDWFLWYPAREPTVVARKLAKERMMELPSLPSPKSTNGSWIYTEARHNIIQHDHVERPLGSQVWRATWLRDYNAARIQYVYRRRYGCS